MGKSQSSRHFAGALARRCSSVSRTTQCGVAVAAVALMLAPAAARAQTASVPVSITVQPVLYISASSGFTFSAASDNDYTTGYVASTAGPSLTHRGNVPYKITIQAQSGSAMTFAVYGTRTDSDPGKPVSDLKLQATTGVTAAGYVALGASGAPGDLYSRATKGGTLNTTIDARLTLNYTNDPPGTYGTTVVFTIVAQ